jgi:hypothetical protein
MRNGLAASIDCVCTIYSALAFFGRAMARRHSELGRRSDGPALSIPRANVKIQSESKASQVLLYYVHTLSSAVLPVRVRVQLI